MLARYRAIVAGGEAGLALPAYLSERVFAGASVSTLEPTAGVAGYERSTPTARPCPAGHRPRAPRARPRARAPARAAGSLLGRYPDICLPKNVARNSPRPISNIEIRSLEFRAILDT